MHIIAERVDGTVVGWIRSLDQILGGGGEVVARLLSSGSDL